jgi:hypothetical protein
MALACAPTTAMAHGGPPSALGLIAATAAGPEVVLLNEGLAVKSSTGWSFLCPSVWGEIDLASGKVPLARSADGVSTWISGSEGVYLLKDQRIAAPQWPELERNKTIAFANDGEFVYGLHLTASSTTEVVRISASSEPSFWPLSEYWSAITTNAAGIHLARVAGDKQLELVTLDRQGLEQGRTVANLAATPLEMQLHTHGERVYATITDGMIAQVGYFEAGTWTDVLRDKPPILGPQAAVGGTLWIAVGGVLARVQPDGIEPAADSRMVTCLDQWNDWTYICLGPDLHRLTDDGVGEHIFGLQGLYAPDPGLVSPIARDSCDLQWVIYSSDARRAGLTFMQGSAFADASMPATTAGAGGAQDGEARSSGIASNGQAGVSGAVPEQGSSELPSQHNQTGGCAAARPLAARRNGLGWIFGLCVLLLWGPFRERKKVYAEGIAGHPDANSLRRTR